MKTGVHQPQVQTGCPQILPHRLAPVRWRVVPDHRVPDHRVPDHRQRTGVSLPKLPQEGGRGSGVAVALQFHPFHLARLQTYRRVVAGLFAIARAGRFHQSLPSWKRGAGSPLSTHWPRSSASARKWAASAKNILAPVRTASSHRAAYSATKASRLASSALTRRFLGRFRTNPSQCR